MALDQIHPKIVLHLVAAGAGWRAVSALIFAETGCPQGGSEILWQTRVELLPAVFPSTHNKRVSHHSNRCWHRVFDAEESSCKFMTARFVVPAQAV